MSPKVNGLSPGRKRNSQPDHGCCGNAGLQAADLEWRCVSSDLWRKRLFNARTGVADLFPAETIPRGPWRRTESGPGWLLRAAK
jgi:hypothetical protein